MKIERKHGWWFIALAAWNVLIWVTFAKNLLHQHSTGEPQPSGYYAAHTVLIVVDLLIGAALAWFGVKVLRAPRTTTGAVEPVDTHA